MKDRFCLDCQENTPFYWAGNSQNGEVVVGIYLCYLCESRQVGEAREDSKGIIKPRFKDVFPSTFGEEGDPVGRS